MRSSQVLCNHAALLELEQTRNKELQQWVQKLVQKVSETTEVLDHQMGSVLQQGHQVVDGPDTGFVCLRGIYCFSKDLTWNFIIASSTATSQLTL